MGNRKTFLKKDRQKFEDQMNNFFQEIATQVEDKETSYYYIQTPFGFYEVRRISASDHLLSVFGAFRDHTQFARAKACGYDCNQYTGKWNFHLSNPSVDICIDHIKLWFARLTENDQLQKQILCVDFEEKRA